MYKYFGYTPYNIQTEPNTLGFVNLIELIKFKTILV